MKRGRPPHDDILTPRQWQVVALLQEGLTNEQIAERLGITADGAKYHVAEILSKLGVSTREEAARAAPPRRRFVLIPLLRSRATPAPVITAGAAAVLVVALLAVVAGVFRGKSSDDTTAGAGVSRSAPDIATLTLPNTILVTKGPPSNVAGYTDALSTLRQVSTAAELKAALTPDIRLIVVDISAYEELQRSDVLRNEIRTRAVMGLNFSEAALRSVTGFRDLFPGPEPPGVRAPATRGEPFYSYLFYGHQWKNGYGHGSHQRYFFERTFETDIGGLDGGKLPDGEGPPLPIAKLPTERIAVNRGMGCTFDDHTTASVTRREVARLQPHVMLTSLVIYFCNHGPPGQTTIGVWLPPDGRGFRFDVATSELMP